ADYQQMPMRCDFGRALAEDSPQHFGRQYAAGWDLRNLRMVANIATTFRERPGARGLAVVGASHQAWLDRLLGQLQGGEVGDVEAFLADWARRIGHAPMQRPGPVPRGSEQLPSSPRTRGSSDCERFLSLQQPVAQHCSLVVRLIARAVHQGHATLAQPGL